MFLAERTVFSAASPPSTMRALPAALNAESIFTTSLVFGASKWMVSITTSSLARSFSERADLTASWRAFFGIAFAWLLGVGPNTVPPPTHSGERMDPTLARPVPFCFQGFLPPPRTRPLVFVAWVPRRSLAIWRTTAW